MNLESNGHWDCRLVVSRRKIHPLPKGEYNCWVLHNAGFTPNLTKKEQNTVLNHWNSMFKRLPIKTVKQMEKNLLSDHVAAKMGIAQRGGNDT